MLAAALGTDLQRGLSGGAADAAARRAAFGSNSLAVSATSSFWQLLLEAASDSTLLLLTAAGAVSLALAAGTGKEAADFIDGAAILASVAICAGVTAVTNYQKEEKFRQLNRLKEDVPVRVMRGGAELTLSCWDLLVGDLLLVEAGDILPADGLLVAGGSLKVDESHLTGESDDVVKEPPPAAAAAAAEQSEAAAGGCAPLASCLMMSGSKVLEGFGRLLVLAVGPNSQQGMIQAMVMGGSTPQPGSSSSGGGGAAAAVPMLREATPLTSRLEDVANSIGGVGLAAAAGVLAVNSGLYTAELLAGGGSLLSSASLEAYLSFFITSMTLLVVAVPEGLPLAVTLALAFSVQRMLADNNLVRNLSSCETMAAATAICSDKTGTLTENNMAVVKLFVGGVTFNVRPSLSTARAQPAALQGAQALGPAALAAAAAPLAAAAPTSNGFGSTVRSTSSIAGSSLSTSDDEQQRQPPDMQPSSNQVAALTSSTASSSSSSVGSALSSVSAGDGAPAAPSRNGSAAAAAAVPVPPDVLTMVSLSWDGEQLYEYAGQQQQQYEGDEEPPRSEAAAALQASKAQQQQQQLQQWQQRQQQREAAASPTAAAYRGVAEDAFAEECSLLADCTMDAALSSTASLFAAPGSSCAASSVSCLSGELRQLLADSISLNSTASIRLVPQEAGGEPGGAKGSSNGSSSSSNGRQLDRSGNRTECALLEFGGRLAGRLLPGAGASEQQLNVLQTFPFSSTRKRMSSLVALGPPLATPGSAGASSQPARLYVKGAAELLLDGCRLQVGLDGGLQPLTPGQVAALKARCGRGGLRVLALAYKDLLLPPAAAAQGSNGGSSGGSSSSGWQLLDGDEDAGGLVLIGLLGLEDPVRAAVPGAITDCQRAGIAVRMITGDNAATAAAIAAECGILPRPLQQQVEETLAARACSGVSSSQYNVQLRQLLAELPLPQALQQKADGLSKQQQQPGWLDGLLHGLSGAAGGADPAAGAALMNSVAPHPALAVLEGPQFRALVLQQDGSTDLDAFAALWPHLRVMARCTPADKFTLVQALKALRARGQLAETVAVTGDGTNDAPALNAADVGFAMAAGTSIAKDASDILLLDNNFTSIVSAVKWGRNVYSAVTKFLQFQLTANVVALVTAAGGALALRASPLSAVQMLWVNLIMDSLASLALATEAPTDEALDEPPRARDGAIITPTVAKAILGQAALQLAVLAALLGPLGEALVGLGQGGGSGIGSGMAAAAAAAVGVMTAAGGALADVAGGELGGGLSPERAEQYTLVFNAFVLMQLFNQVNARKIHDEPDVLAGLSQQRLFLGILGLEAGLQVAIVQMGGRAFSTVPLSAQQWAVCLGFGGLTLLARRALRAIPTEPPPPGGPPGGSSSSSSSSGSGSTSSKALGAASAAVARPLQAVQSVARMTLVLPCTP
ncbi:hypothetical protein OEZ86_000039 [Tetradesmus obliquus]|nr:hypothetical protein OEZ86_000039 [Tetradesmus obliquus]